MTDRKFSDDDYEELYYRIAHKLNNMYLLIQTKINVKTMGRKLVWQKQRAKEKSILLEEILKTMRKPKRKKIR